MREFYTKRWAGGFVAYDYLNDGKGPYKTTTQCLSDGMTRRLKWATSNKYAAYQVIIWKNKFPLYLGAAYYSPFSRDQIISHLEEIKEIVKFDYTLIERFSYFFLVVLIDLEKYPNDQTHFYVWTRIRYLWEYPQSVLLHDAFRLKEQDELFSERTIDELYHLIVSSLPSNVRVGSYRGKWYDSYHSIPLSSGLIIDKLYPEEFKLSGIFPFRQLNSLPHFSNIKAIPISAPRLTDLFNSYKYWSTDLGFKTRVPYYTANLKRLMMMYKKMKKRSVKVAEPDKEELKKLIGESSKSYRLIDKLIPTMFSFGVLSLSMKLIRILNTSTRKKVIKQMIESSE